MATHRHCEVCKGARVHMPEYMCREIALTVRHSLSLRMIKITDAWIDLLAYSTTFKRSSISNICKSQYIVDEI